MATYQLRIETTDAGVITYYPQIMIDSAGWKYLFTMTTGYIIINDYFRQEFDSTQHAAAVQVITDYQAQEVAAETTEITYESVP